MGFLRHRELEAGLAILSGISGAYGQIATDGTVGAAKMLTGPAFQIPDTLGRQVGGNLFHSFQTFNVGLGESATFSGPNTIANVLARVTGGQRSAIDGTLRCTIPSADFYLVNPAGVVFGPSATVDVGGAFAVTTADYMKLGNSGKFDARNAANDVLTVAPPSAFGFLTPAPGASIAGVAFQGTQTALKAGSGLTVVAGDVQLHEGAALKAPGGLIQVAAVAAAGELPLEGVGASGFAELGDIVIDGDSVLSCSSDTGGGQFLVRGKNLTLEGTASGSWLANGARQSGIAKASEVDLRGDLRLDVGSQIAVTAYGEASGDSLLIRAKQIEVRGASWLNTSTHGSGNSGILTLETGSLLVDNAGLASLSRSQEAGGAAGNISIHAGSVEVLNGGLIDASSLGLGPAGRISIEADIMALQGAGSSVKANSMSSGAGGPAGEIAIDAGTIGVTDGGVISADSWGQGRAGRISLQGETVAISGQRSIVYVSANSMNSGAGGSAGEIAIDAGTLDVTDGAAISADSWGQGTAGRISLHGGTVAIGSIATVSADSLSEDTGELAGQVEIDTHQISIQGGGVVSASSYGPAGAGTVRLKSDTLSVDGQGLDDALVAADSLSGGAGGPAGSVNVDARLVEIRDGGKVTARTYGLGKAGLINVLADEFVLDGEWTAARVSAGSLKSGPSGDAGIVSVQATTMQVANDAQISASTRGSGSAGLIAIGTTDLSLTAGLASNTKISADSDGSGRAGSIDIAAGHLSLQGLVRTASITANSADVFANADAGQIEIRADRLEMGPGGIIIADAAGMGAAGPITIHAGQMTMRGSPSLLALVSTESAGGDARAGIRIEARSLQMLDSARLRTGTTGAGKAGTIDIVADKLELNGSVPGVDIKTGSADAAVEGDSGDVRIEVGTLTMSGTASITTSPDGTGNAGAISIKADQMLLGGEDSVVVGLNSGTSGVGLAGNITIDGGVIRLRDYALVSASTSGSGAAGNIRINADELTLGGTGAGAAFITSDSFLEAGMGGNAGKIEINANLLKISDRAGVHADTFNAGRGGDIVISADRMTLGGGGISYGGITSETLNEAAGGSGGNIQIHAGELNIGEWGRIGAQTFGSGRAGSISIEAQALRMQGVLASISSGTDGGNEGAGQGGDIALDVGTLSLAGGARVSTTSSGPGRAGGITVKANSISIAGGGIGAGIKSESFKSGGSGDIRVQVGDLSITDAGWISALTWGPGAGGTVTIDATKVVLDGWFSMITADTWLGGGPAGSIDLHARDLQIRNGASVSSETKGGGRGGDIHILSGSILVDGRQSAITAGASQGKADGPAGNIEVVTDSAVLSNGGEIRAETWGLGGGGGIALTADRLFIDGDYSSISTSSREFGEGKAAGSIVITTPLLQIDHKGAIESEAWGHDRGGAILLDLGELNLDNAATISTLSAMGPGHAGDIQIRTTSGSVSLHGGSQIASSSDYGVAGSISVSAAGRINIINSSATVESSFNDAGTISLYSPSYILLQNSALKAEAYLNGGNLNLNTSIFGLDNSSLYANAIEGNGGRIEITADFMYRLGNWQIRYDSANQTAKPGTLSIHSAVDFAGSLVGLPGGLIGAGTEVREGCARRNPRSNSFVVRGKGGVSLRPDAFILIGSLPPSSLLFDEEVLQ